MADERTPLTLDDELAYRTWLAQNKITDADQPGSFYDYRGFFKEFGSKPMQFGQDHFTDTYKQHGHPTFSAESQYSRGPQDGGRWLGEDTLVAAPMASHAAAPLSPSQAHQRAMVHLLRGLPDAGR
jgi:hypothetical protein